MNQTKGFAKVAFANAASKYKNVPVSCNVVIGATGNGNKGDYIDGILVVVANASTSGVTLTDGVLNAVDIMPNAVGGGVGAYPIPLGIESTNGPWRVVTNAGATAIVMGLFA